MFDWNSWTAWTSPHTSPEVCFTGSFFPRKVMVWRRSFYFVLGFVNFQGLTVKLREGIHPFRWSIDWPPTEVELSLCQGLEENPLSNQNFFLVLQTLLMLTWILIGFDCHWFTLIVIFDVISGFTYFSWWLQMSYIKLLCFLCLVTVWCFSYFKISSLAADFFGPFEADLGIDHGHSGSKKCFLQDDMVIPNGGKGC